MLNPFDYGLLRDLQIIRFREELATISGAFAALSLDFDAVIISCEDEKQLEEIRRSRLQVLWSAAIVFGKIDILVFCDCKRVEIQQESNDGNYHSRFQKISSGREPTRR